jgi:FkbM family methyltransferase
MLLLERQGFSGNTVIDIGAAEGAFFLARKHFNMFPQAHHFFIDAMEENEPLYKKISRCFAADFAITALSCLEGSVNMRIDPNFYNTHITSVQNTEYAQMRTLPLTTLDRLVQGRSLKPPYILKLDVQGAELDVLRGALATLAQSVIVTTEIQIFLERDNIVELLAFMQGQGFVLFDLTEQGYYPSSNVLCQCYATFIPKAMDFRKNLKWCTPEQEPVVNEQLRARRASNMQLVENLIASVSGQPATP